MVMVSEDDYTDSGTITQQYGTPATVQNIKPPSPGKADLTVGGGQAMDNGDASNEARVGDNSIDSPLTDDGGADQHNTESISGTGATATGYSPKPMNQITLDSLSWQKSNVFPMPMPSPWNDGPKMGQNAGYCKTYKSTKDGSIKTFCGSYMYQSFDQDWTPVAGGDATPSTKQSGATDSQVVATGDQTAQPNASATPNPTDGTSPANGSDGQHQSVSILGLGVILIGTALALIFL